MGFLGWGIVRLCQTEQSQSKKRRGAAAGYLLYFTLLKEKLGSDNPFHKWFAELNNALDKLSEHTAGLEGTATSSSN